VLDIIRGKIRALIFDLIKSDFEVFTYTNSDVFTLSEDHIENLTAVLKNGIPLGSGEYSYSAITNKITIMVSLVSEDEIEVDFTHYKYSDTELTEYIRASLVWMSIYSYGGNDYELETEDDTDDIYPTPPNKDTDLIALVSSILIKPDYSKYVLPNVTVVYPRTKSKEGRIEELISKYKMSLGVNGTLEFE